MPVIVLPEGTSGSCDDFVRVGDPVPDFTLSSQPGFPVSLKDFYGSKCVVLYFYPKDDTPGCITEACAFRDQYEVFKSAGAEKIVMSSKF